jgi:hypothetical protein
MLLNAPEKLRSQKDSPANDMAVIAAIPAEVDLILSAMDAAHDPEADRREQRRRPFRAQVVLRLFSDPPDIKPWILYSRDIDSRGMGFITPHRLPLGYGGWVELIVPEQTKLHVHCTLFRCRQAVHGWFEGALYFNREQHLFAEEAAEG